MNRNNNIYFSHYLQNSSIFRNVSKYFLTLYEDIATTISYVTHNCALTKSNKFKLKINGKKLKKKRNKKNCPQLKQK